MGFSYFSYEVSFKFLISDYLTWTEPREERNLIWPPIFIWSVPYFLSFTFIYLCFAKEHSFFLFVFFACRSMWQWCTRSMSVCCGCCCRFPVLYEMWCRKKLSMPLLFSAFKSNSSASIISGKSITLIFVWWFEVWSVTEDCSEGVLMLQSMESILSFKRHQK